MIITVDGPSGVGKGTLSKALAKHLGYAYLDTGFLFRAVAYTLKDIIISEENQDTIRKNILSMALNNIPETILRSEETAQLASNLATIPLIRESLLTLQHQYIKDHKNPGVVLDGRDCGTVIAPQAEKKIFLTASKEKRAERRYLEFLQKGLSVHKEKILEQLQNRDKQDESRLTSPLKPAHDAFIIDTSDLFVENVFKKALFFIES